MIEEIEDIPGDPVERLLQEKKPASSGKGIALIALLIALAVAAESGWQWWQAWSSGADGATHQQAMNELQSQQDRLTRSVASFQAQLDATEPPIDPVELGRLSDQIRSAQQKIGGLQGQSGEDTATIAALQGSARSMEQRLSAVERE